MNMMKNVFFSGTAAIEIQGPHVLEFISINNKQAEFDVIGLSNPKIRVVDTRPTVCKTMRAILENGKVETLADEFNKPARVTILPAEDGQIIVQLAKTRAQKPRHMLWVAIGIGEDIPYYDYKKVEIQQMEDNNYALFSLYKRPRLVKQV
jgi:hypothetical protein